MLYRGGEFNAGFETLKKGLISIIKKKKKICCPLENPLPPCRREETGS